MKKVIMSAVVNAVMSALPVILIISVVSSLLASFKNFIDKITTSASAEVMQGIDGTGVTDYIKIDENNNIVFVKDKDGKEFKEVFIEHLKEAGVSADGIDLTKNNLIEDIINAEIVTDYPYLGGDGLQGIVNFYRRDYDAKDEDEGTLMTYVSPEKFNELKKKRKLGQDKKCIYIKKRKITF